MSTLYISENEATEIISKRIKEAIEERKRMLSVIQEIKTKPYHIRPAEPTNVRPLEHLKPHLKFLRISVEMPSKKWLLELHKRSKKLLDFSEILDEYSSFLGRKLGSDDKYHLAFSLKELVKEGKLQFKEGKTYFRLKE
jgi:hypothetical protein